MKMRVFKYYIYFLLLALIVLLAATVVKNEIESTQHSTTSSVTYTSDDLIKIREAENKLAQLQVLSDTYFRVNRRLPKNMDELTKGSDGNIEYLPLDPWGYPYIMQRADEKITFKSRGLTEITKK
ncbi:hypothetical protein [Plesiomonas shigelloides]|uniref:hypothetical protein n=1 Tax=Plesiomonas shigelloides TaxID=703 RepID=UPI003EBADB17